MTREPGAARRDARSRAKPSPTPLAPGTARQARMAPRHVDGPMGQGRLENE